MFYNYNCTREGTRGALVAFGTVILSIQLVATAILEQTICISSNGSIADVSQLPRCPDGARINLLSYKFINVPCHSGIDCDLQLSPAQVVHIHQICSLREVCLSMDFPHQTTARKLNVNYECLDHFTEFLDICDNTMKPIYNTVHLLSTVTSDREETRQCHCSITEGEFSLILNDIRLLIANGSKCSTAQLQIGLDSYTCDYAKAGYGSIFNVQTIPSANIILRKILPSAQPQMIWLIIKPKETLKLSCESTSWLYTSTSSASKVNELDMSRNVTISTHQYEDDFSRTFSVSHIIAIVGGPVLFILTVTVITYTIYRKRYGTPSRHKETHSVKDLVSSETGQYASGKRSGCGEDYAPDISGKAANDQIELKELMPKVEESADIHSKGGEEIDNLKYFRQLQDQSRKEIKSHNSSSFGYLDETSAIALESKYF